MVDVHVYRDECGRLSRFHAFGHAGWAQSGDDVVCAAVSTLLQAAWLGLTEIAKVDVQAEHGDGELTLRWAESAGSEAAVWAIAETVTVSLERIAAQYPKHVRVTAQQIALP